MWGRACECRYLQRPGEGVRSPGITSRSSCCWSWESSPRSLQEQYLRLAAVPSFQPQITEIWYQQTGPLPKNCPRVCSLEHDSYSRNKYRWHWRWVHGGILVEHLWVPSTMCTWGGVLDQTNILFSFYSLSCSTTDKHFFFFKANIFKETVTSDDLEFFINVS